jgi:predicted transposase YdaD
MTSRPHDALFKAAFEHPDHAGSLLRSVLPDSIVQAIDWTTLTHQPGSFIDPDLADTHTDLLFSARLGAHEVRLYLLFEHLSTLHLEEPRRVLRYPARAEDSPSITRTARGSAAASQTVDCQS